MPTVVAVGTADAPYKISQNEVKTFVHNLFGNSKINIDRMISVFDNSAVQNRHVSLPLQWYGEQHSFPERNMLFRDTSMKLAVDAVERCLSKAGADVKDIGHIFFVTSTGLTTPTVDALLFNHFKMDTHVKRTPLWGLGCAGGAAGLSRAFEYTKAFPEHTALLLSIELCSLTFQKDDLSKSNIIACSLFSDGAAAALVKGGRSENRTDTGIDIIDTFSTTYYDSLDVMGWDIIETGFKVIFSRDIPSIVRQYVEPGLRQMLGKHGLSISDIRHYVTHPGGLKVINAYEQSLGLSNGALNLSRKVLAEHGNMSSPSVLYVLDEFLSSDKYTKGDYGVLSALGPGFSSEMILFKTL